MLEDTKYLVPLASAQIVFTLPESAVVVTDTQGVNWLTFCCG